MFILPIVKLLLGALPFAVALEQILESADYIPGAYLVEFEDSVVSPATPPKEHLPTLEKNVPQLSFNLANYNLVHIFIFIHSQ